MQLAQTNRSVTVRRERGRVVELELAARLCYRAPLGVANAAANLVNGRALRSTYSW